MSTVSEEQAELYVAQQTFCLARNVLMEAAEKAKKHCVVLYSDSDKSHSALARGTDLNDPGIQLCILSLAGWLPASFVPTLQRSLAEAAQEMPQ